MTCIYSYSVGRTTVWESRQAWEVALSKTVAAHYQRGVGNFLDPNLNLIRYEGYIPFVRLLFSKVVRVRQSHILWVIAIRRKIFIFG